MKNNRTLNDLLKLFINHFAANECLIFKTSYNSERTSLKNKPKSHKTNKLIFSFANIFMHFLTLLKAWVAYNFGQFVESRKKCVENITFCEILNNTGIFHVWHVTVGLFSYAFLDFSFSFLQFERSCRKEKCTLPKFNWCRLCVQRYSTANFALVHFLDGFIN